MIGASYWSPRAILEALGAALAARCSVARVPGEPGGGTSFPTVIAYGDENLNAWQDASRGRAVLTLGAGPVVGPLEFAVEEMLCCWRPIGEVHIWTPSGRASMLERLDAAWQLTHCVLAALHDRHHGWPSAPDLPALEVTPEREPKLFRHGQANVITFPIRIPVFAGRPVEILGAGSTIGTAQPGGGGGFEINPA
jgi:hypothetical protein